MQAQELKGDKQTNFLHTLPRSLLWSAAPSARELCRWWGSSAGKCNPPAQGSTESPSGQSWTPQHSCGTWREGKAPDRSENPSWPGRPQMVLHHFWRRTTPPHHPQSPMRGRGKKSKTIFVSDKNLHLKPRFFHKWSYNETTDDVILIKCFSKVFRHAVCGLFGFPRVCIGKLFLT